VCLPVKVLRGTTLHVQARDSWCRWADAHAMSIAHPYQCTRNAYQVTSTDASAGTSTITRHTPL